LGARSGLGRSPPPACSGAGRRWPRPTCTRTRGVLPPPRRGMGARPRSTRGALPLSSGLAAPPDAALPPGGRSSERCLPIVAPPRVASRWSLLRPCPVPTATFAPLLSSQARARHGGETTVAQRASLFPQW
jgi:hypothetical protein